MCYAASAKVFYASPASAVLDQRPWQWRRHDQRVLVLWSLRGNSENAAVTSKLCMEKGRLCMSHPHLANIVQAGIIKPYFVQEKCCDGYINRKFKKHLLWKQTLDFNLVLELWKSFHNGAWFSWEYLQRPSYFKVAAIWSQPWQTSSLHTQQNEDNKGRKREVREGDLDPVDTGLESTAIHKKLSGTVCEYVRRTP